MKKSTSRGRMAALLATTALVAAACGTDAVTDAAGEVADDVSEAVEGDGESEGEGEGGGGPLFDLEFAGLEPLGDGFEYEGWVVVDGEALSTGRFTIAEIDGESEYTAGPVATLEQAAAGTDFILSVEPTENDDPAPSDAKPLGGAIVDGVAELSVAHPAALGQDFAGATGDFVITTPTTQGTDDDVSGVWFIELTDDGPVAGLDELPELPVGWVYEGWVVIDDVPVSTGRFVDAAAPDLFDGFSGDEDSPPFPGEDFITNAPDGLEFPADLTDGTSQVVISIEPEIDDSPAPFALKPLAYPIAEGTETGVQLDLQAGPPLTTGTATLIEMP